jgi:kynureninase
MVTFDVGESRWKPWRDKASELDQTDVLSFLPDRFHRYPGLYFDGNSLGLMHRDGPARIARVVEAWRDHAVMAWHLGDDPWFARAERIAGRLARLVGANPGQLAMGASTTVALHQLLATFYRPERQRWRIVIDAQAFPTDRYAAQSQLRLQGFDPMGALRVIPTGADRLLADDAIEAAFDGSVALAILPAVVYTTGQRLEVGAVTRLAHRHGVFVIWDLSHSAGLFPHRLVEEDVDAAVFCTYKYLSGGPGSPAATFVHPRHLPLVPGLGGWWGSDKRRQFQMADEQDPAPDAGALQLGTPSPLALAPLEAVLPVFEEVGLDKIWERAGRLRGFLLQIAETELVPLGMGLIRPTAAGGHLALTHKRALELGLALRARQAVVDFRPPDVLRICPSPLTGRFGEIVDLARILADLLAHPEALQADEVPPVV